MRVENLLPVSNNIGPQTPARKLCARHANISIRSTSLPSADGNKVLVKLTLRELGSPFPDRAIEVRIAMERLSVREGGLSRNVAGLGSTIESGHVEGPGRGRNGVRCENGRT